MEEKTLTSHPVLKVLRVVQQREIPGTPGWKAVTNRIARVIRSKNYLSTETDEAYKRILEDNYTWANNQLKKCLK